MFYFFKRFSFIIIFFIIGFFWAFTAKTEETLDKLSPEAPHSEAPAGSASPPPLQNENTAAKKVEKPETSHFTSFPLSVNSIEYPQPVTASFPHQKKEKIAISSFLREKHESEDSVFLVKNVGVELIPVPSSDIRQTALEQAQHQAFQILFKRMTGQETSNIPEFSVLKRLIKSYQVHDEAITGRFYKAHYTIIFFPEAVRTLLHSQNISFAETYSKPILLIPIYRIDGRPFPLFSQDNTWGEHWRQTNQQQGTLVRLIIPPIDTIGLLYDDIAEKKMVNILQFLRQNDVEIALISIASLYTTPGQPYRLEITDRLISETGQIESLPPFSLQSTIEPLNKLMQTALEKSLNRLEEAWKHHNLLKDKEIKQQVVHINYENLNQWLELKDHLNKVSLIQNYQVNEIFPTKLTINVKHYGSIDHLKQAVEAHNLRLYLDKDEWFLQLAAVHQYLQEGSTYL